jgi:hypothetical protein
VTQITDSPTEQRRVFEQRPTPLAGLRGDRQLIDLVPLSYWIDGVEVSKDTYYLELVREAKRLGLASWPQDFSKDFTRSVQ